MDTTTARFKRPFTAAADMDDVLFKWGEGFTEQFTMMHPGVKVIPGELRPRFNMFLEEEADIHHLIQETMDAPDFYSKLEPMPGAKKALAEMEDAGINMLICSSPFLTNPTCANDKYAAMAKHFGDQWPSRVILAGKKAYVRADVLIDDRPDIPNAELAEWDQVLFAAHHNLYLGDVPRMEDWSQWREFVLTHPAANRRI